MVRTIKVERLYSHWKNQYENIKFIQEVADIPDELADNPEYIAGLYNELLAECDIAFVEYKRTHDAIARDNVKDALEYLKQEREEVRAGLDDMVAKTMKAKEEKLKSQE